LQSLVRMSMESSLHLSAGSLRRSRRGDFSLNEKRCLMDSSGSLNSDCWIRFRLFIRVFLSFSRKQFMSRRNLASRSASIFM